MSNSGGGGGLSPIGGLQPIGGGGIAPPTAQPSPPDSSGKGTAGSGGLSSVGGPATLSPVASPPAAAAPSASAPPLSGAPSMSGIGAIGGGLAAPAATSAAGAVQPPPTMFTQPTSPRPAVTSAPARPSAMPVYEEEEATGPNKLLIAIVTLILLPMLFAVYMVVRPSPPATIPTDFTEFTSKDGSFTCEGPAGWNVEAGGKSAGETKSFGLNGVTYTSGGAGIEINISDVRALVGAQLLFGNGPVPEAATGSRANGAMQMGRKPVATRFKGFHETDLTSEVAPFLASRIKMGGRVLDGSKMIPDFRLSEWTSDGDRFGFGGKYHGYRAAMGGGEIIAEGLCYCSEKDWPKLKGPFLHTLASIRDNKLKESIEELRKSDGSLAIPGAGNFVMPSTP